MVGSDCKCKCDFKSWLVQGIVVAALYLGMDMFFHHFCMARHYQNFAHLFRSTDEIIHLRGWGYFGYLWFGLLFTCIYMKGYDADRSAYAQGFRYGLLMGLFYWGAQLLISYPYMPWPNRIYAGWFAIGIFEFIVLGFILGFLYKPKATT